jgi:hypothetical protein
LVYGWRDQRHIAGTKFIGAAKVSFRDVAATRFTVVSSIKMASNAPGSVAAHIIHVTRPDGTSSKVVADEPLTIVSSELQSQFDSLVDY